MRRMRTTRGTIVAAAGIAAALGLGGAGVAAALCAGPTASATSPGSLAKRPHLVSAKAAGGDTGAGLDDTFPTTASSTTLPDTTTTTSMSDDTSTTLEPTTTTLASTGSTTPTTVAGNHEGCDRNGGHDLTAEHHRGNDGDADDQIGTRARKVDFTVSTSTARHDRAPGGGDFARRRHGGH